MTSHSTFGRRSPPKLPTPYKTRQKANATDDFDDPQRSWGWGRTILVIAGGLVLIDVIQGRTGEPKPVAAASAAAPAVVAQKTPEPCMATLKEYLALKTGMSPQGAASIIGCPGTEMTRAAFAGQETVILSWDGNAFLSNMNATFDNGRLTAKAQLGLK